MYLLVLSARRFIPYINHLFRYLYIRVEQKRYIKRESLNIMNTISLYNNIKYLLLVIMYLFLAGERLNTAISKENLKYVLYMPKKTKFQYFWVV